MLGHLAKGKTNKEIAGELFITERTVKFYVSAILGKLGAKQSNGSSNDCRPKRFGKIVK